MLLTGIFPTLSLKMRFKPGNTWIK